MIEYMVSGLLVVVSKTLVVILSPLMAVDLCT